MTAGTELEQHRWSSEGLLRAWDAGGFDDAHVERVDGEVWVRGAGAEPQLTAMRRMALWDPADVLTEVSDETLTTKARLCAAAGFAVCWVVSGDGVHEHAGPARSGCRSVRQHWPGDTIAVPCADHALDVAPLTGGDDERTASL